MNGLTVLDEFQLRAMSRSIGCIDTVPVWYVEREASPAPGCRSRTSGRLQAADVSDSEGDLFVRVSVRSQ